MRRKDTLEFLKAQGVKALRSGIRLKHSLAAEAEVNEKVPAFEEQYDRLLLQGEVPEVKQMVADLLEAA